MQLAVHDGAVEDVAGTIVTEIPDDRNLMTQEPFGPIAPIVTCKDFDEVVERANSLHWRTI